MAGYGGRLWAKTRACRAASLGRCSRTLALSRGRDIRTRRVLVRALGSSACSRGENYYPLSTPGARARSDLANDAGIILIARDGQRADWKQRRSHISLGRYPMGKSSTSARNDACRGKCVVVGPVRALTSLKRASFWQMEYFAVTHFLARYGRTFWRIRNVAVTRRINSRISIRDNGTRVDSRHVLSHNLYLREPRTSVPRALIRVPWITATKLYPPCFTYYFPSNYSNYRLRVHFLWI